MAKTSDSDFFSPRDLLQGDHVCLDGQLIVDATKFAVQCLEVPRTIETLISLAGITQGIYNEYADILKDLFGTFCRMWLVADGFVAIVETLDTVCRQIGDFAAKIDSSLSMWKTLFDYFRELRKDPSSQVKGQIHQLNMEFIVLANQLNTSSSAIDISRIISSWDSEKANLGKLYERILDRMRDPQLQKIMERLLHITGGVTGLENLKKWIESLSSQESKATEDLKMLIASVRANQYDATALEKFLDEPHSKETDRVMDTEVANLVYRWNILKNKMNELRQNHLQVAIDAIHNVHPHP